VKESTISFSGMGIGHLIRYFSVTFISRFIGVELLGLYAISTAVTRIMEVLGKFGLEEAILKFVSGAESQQRKKLLIRSALKMGLISSVIAMLIQIIIANWLSINIFHETSFLTLIIIVNALSLPFFILIHISSFSTQAYKILKYKIFVSEILIPIILLFSMIGLYIFISPEFAIMFPFLFSSIIGLFAINSSLKKVTNVSITSLTAGIFNRDLIAYSVPIMFLSILGTILHWTDVFMLGYFKDAYTVGLYHPASRTAGIIRIILLSFSGIYAPIMMEMFVKKQIMEMDYIFKLVTRWITTLSIPFVILIFIYSKKVMLIFGADFVSGYSILMILVIAAFIQAIFGISGMTLNMTGFAKLNLMNVFICLSLNIGLNILFIPKMGGFGAAIATLCTLISISFIRGIQNWRFLQLNPFSWKLIKPLLAGIIAMLLGYIVKPFIMSFHTIITLICATSVIFIIFFLFLWIFNLDEDDIELIKTLYKIKNKFS